MSAILLKPAKYYQKSYRCGIKGGSIDLQGTVMTIFDVDEGEIILKIQVDEASSKALSKLEDNVVAFFIDNQETLMITSKKRFDVQASFQSCTHVDHILKLRVVGETDVSKYIGKEISFKLNLKNLVIFRSHSYVTFTLENLTSTDSNTNELLENVSQQIKLKLNEIDNKKKELENELESLATDIVNLNELLESLPDLSQDQLKDLVVV